MTHESQRFTGQAAPNFENLDFSSPYDEVVEAEIGTIPTGELSGPAQAILPDVTTGLTGYDASKDHPNQKGGLNHVAYARQTPEARLAAVNGIALARQHLKRG